MARYYTETSKENFLSKVKELFESKEFPYKKPKDIETDLGKVNFDWENYTRFEETSGYSIYPVGYRELKPDFHIFFVNAGGDWEFPICFIFYWGANKLRAYIPQNGNIWNKKEKCAWGSEDEMFENFLDEDEDFYDYDKLAKEISEPKMVEEILKHITKK
jgi:hypothetical protein